MSTELRNRWQALSYPHHAFKLVKGEDFLPHEKVETYVQELIDDQVREAEASSLLDQIEIKDAEHIQLVSDLLTAREERRTDIQQIKAGLAAIDNSSLELPIKRILKRLVRELAE